jgi:hypothetical protein
MTVRSTLHTTFAGHRRLATGTLQANALAAWKALDANPAEPLMMFDDDTGRTVDIDLRGSATEVAARFAEAMPSSTDAANAATTSDTASDPASDTAAPKGRGRPRLGVIPREVTLLPRHWDWLAEQPGGASVVLRKLVEDARRNGAAQQARRMAQERTYHFMSAIGGDLPGFEEATRALFADDLHRFDALLAAWPADVREHAMRLAAACESQHQASATEQ